MYRLDPGSAYDMTYDELIKLKNRFGEDETIIDAMLRAGNASDEERLEALGLPPSDSWMIYH